MRNPRQLGAKIKKKTSSNPKDSRSGLSRIHVLNVIFIVVATLIATRLFFLQGITHQKWVALALDQHQAFLTIAADRGEVSMRDGDHTYPLAVNREYPTLYAVPKEITEPDKTAIELSTVLGMEASVIKERLDRPDDPFEILKKRLSDEEIEKVKALNLKGIKFLPEKYRYYPAGELASQVIGFASLGENGGASGYGIEASKDDTLRGIAGELTQEKDAAGRWIPLTDRSVVSAKHGEDVVLTLDRVIQYETERIMREAIDKYEAERATAIVMDPKTGKVLAMASFPQFDPNNYSKIEDMSLFLNPAVSLAYEPGSIMKPLTMAVGLEEGKVSPSTEYVDTGVIQEAGYSIRNADDKVYGRSSMTKVLEESINTGVIYVERLVTNAVFRDYMKRFGFGERTGIELPAELPGNMRNLENIRSHIQFFTASFGQGVTATPLQMVTAYAAMANGGNLMKPQIVEKIIHADGKEELIEPTVVRRVLSEETSKQMGEMLRAVVVNGHGKRADVPGYRVGGKTGTAQVAKSGSKGYEDGLSIGSFVGYAPIDDPQFAVLVKLDNPRKVEWAESSAAPAFGEIMKFLLEYAKIKPTEDTNEKPK
ncbi:MAG: penicillin-binding protein 2 [Patescibacteria group bacterium]